MREGLQHHQAGRFREAEAAYADALQLDPQNIDALHFSGVIAYQEGRYEEADRLISQALSRNPVNPPAHNNLGNLRVKQGRPAEAIASFERAISLQPDYLDAYFNLAALRESRDELDEAIACYERALSLDPDSSRSCSALANAYLRRNRLDEAATLCRKSLALDPDSPQAHFLLGSLLQRRGEGEEAEACYRRAIALRPDFSEAHCALGHVVRERGQPGEAVSNYERALAADPNNVAAHSGLATALLDLGEFDGAISAYRAAVALNPKAPEAHSNLGNALRQAGRLEESVASCREALALSPAFAPALCNLGAALEGQEKLGEAIGCYRRAVELEPELAEVHYNLGNALAKAGWRSQALEHFRSALTLDRSCHQARWALTMSQLPMVCDIDEKPEDHRKAFSRELSDLERWFEGPGKEAGHAAIGAQPPFALAYQEEDNRALLQRLGKVCAGAMAQWLQQQGIAPPANRRARSVVRVGVVSGHFRGGSIWEAVIEGWFRNLDRDRFALHAFHLETVHDEQTAVARSVASRFEAGARGLRQWVDAIAAAELDVLIYPEIGLHPLTLKLASLRLAPVQIATWGHPQTTGLPTIDYYLSAEGMEPENAQEHYTERLVTLPNLGCFYYRSAEPAPATPQSGSSVLDRDAPILVCPGTPFKYAPQFDWIFPEIARNLKSCRFVFFNFWVGDMSAKLRSRLEQVFARRGMEFSDFALFAPWQSRGAFHELLKRATVYLDTIGYSGFNTAMQAVECGLPIVARQGRFLRGRFASGILNALALPELVAGSEEDYIATAVRLCREARYRDDVRARMESRRHRLFEDLAPVRALEAFLSEAARR